eukprot:2406411-Rhodomonas_salina.3
MICNVKPAGRIRKDNNYSRPRQRNPRRPTNTTASASAISELPRACGRVTSEPCWTHQSGHKIRKGAHGCQGRSSTTARCR